MTTLQITYAGYAFHTSGVPQYGHAMSAEDQSLAPRKLRETFRVKHRFFETTFADNEARWTALKEALRVNPTGTLVIEDEKGNVIENRAVHFSSIDGAEEWGQYRREVTVVFETIGGVLNLDALAAQYTPTGGAAVVLPNVVSWNGAIKTERPSTHTVIRREAIETINASGKYTADPTLTLAGRREALLTHQAAIRGAARCKDGTLTFGSGFSKVMQIDNLTAEINEGMEELTWNLSAFRRDFPDGSYAELDYEVTSSDEREQNLATVSVSGKCVAHTKAAAEAAALAVKTSYTTGRQFLGQELKERVLSGKDGSDDCVELTFTFRFKAILGSVISYTLKITTEYDARAGDVTTTYSGTVVAASLAAAVTQARSLGDGKESAAGLFKMNSREEQTTTSVGGADIAIQVDFSYTYLGKSAIEFAEVTAETNTDFFGTNSLVISGSCTAATGAAALTFARTFKTSGFLERSIRESPVETHKGDVPGVIHLVRMDFAYAYTKACVRTTLSYGRETVHDFGNQQTTLTYSGVCYGASEAACNAAIDVLIAGATGRKMRSERRANFANDATNAIAVLESVSFTEVFVGALTATDAADIIEAQYSVSYRYGLWIAAIDEIPFAAVYVQAATKQTCGVITVSGSITVNASALATAQAFAADKKLLAAGYLDVAEETPTYDYAPGSSMTVQKIRYGFQYASRDPSLVA